VSRVRPLPPLLLLAAGAAGATPAPPARTLDVWPASPPGETRALPPEADQTRPTDKLVAGRPLIRLGNVSTPQLAVFRPEPRLDTGAAVIICPGGGFNILAYDLEGTEVAAWLNGLGITGIVLKYRVPARDPARRWLAAVQDAQRAMSLVRSKAGEWGLRADRLGILGFSAGGATAAYTALAAERLYPAVDAADTVPWRPDFALLIYTGGFVERGQTTLSGVMPVGPGAPPMFLVHAFDDAVPVQNTLLLAAELRRAGGSAEVHVYDAGGHGYGLRPDPALPVTSWPERAAAWLRRRGWLEPAGR
jgi:acetyl esterase/lipase